MNKSNGYYIYTFPPNLFDIQYETVDVPSPVINTEEKSAIKKPAKCVICKSKRCLVECKCSKTVCLKHRYAIDHNCDYNVKEATKDKLRTELVKVVADKLERI